MNGIDGLQPVQSDSSYMGATPGESNKLVDGVEDQSGRVASVMEEVRSQRVGEIPKKLKPSTINKIERMSIVSLEHYPKAIELKKQTEKTTSVLSTICSFSLRILSYLNPMAYFKKDKSRAIAAAPPEFVKATPEQLMAAARKLNTFMIQKEAVIHLQAETIFRLDFIKEEKIKLFNQLMTSLDSVDLTQVENAHLLAVVFKKVYRDMNLFGGLLDNFIEIGKALPKNKADESRDEAIELLKKLKALLSKDGQQGLKNFIQVLAEASKYEDQNKMNAEALAVVAGPNLCSSIFKVEQFVIAAKITEQFIKYYVEVFEDG